MAKAAKGKKGNAKFKLPKPVPSGTVLQDFSKKKFWCVGSSLGKGGFGEIYAANEGDKIDKKNQKYAIKIEPKENGPLFVEQAFFIRVCTIEKLDTWKKKEGRTFLGIPALRGFGNHKLGDDELRFLVMDKFGKDFWSYFNDNDKKLDTKVVSKVSIQMIDALEYIHASGYVHGDVKGTNMLFEGGKSDNVYLVDFGLAELISTVSPFKPDPKRQHNGTIEYISCDMHQGVPTRRSDMEILGYNILHWLTSTLPWEGKSNPPEVFKMKQDFLNDLKAKKLDVPEIVSDFFKNISKLSHLDIPDYDGLRKIIAKHSNVKKSPLKRNKTTATNSKKKIKVDQDDDADDGDDEEGSNEIEEPCSSKTGSSRQKSKSNIKLDSAKSVKVNPKDKENISWKDIPAIKASGLFNAAGKSIGNKKTGEGSSRDSGEWVSPKGKDIIPGAPKRKIKVPKKIVVVENGQESESDESDPIESPPMISLKRSSRLKKTYSPGMYTSPDESF